MRKYDKLLELGDPHWQRNKILACLKPSIIYKIRVAMCRSLGYNTANIIAIPRSYNSGSVSLEILAYEGEPRSGRYKSISYYAFTQDNISKIEATDLPLYINWNWTDRGKNFLSQKKTLRRAA